MAQKNEEMYEVALSHSTSMYADDVFTDYAGAVAYVNEVGSAWGDELSTVPDFSIASSDNMYAVKVGERWAQVLIYRD